MSADTVEFLQPRLSYSIPIDIIKCIPCTSRIRHTPNNLILYFIFETFWKLVLEKQSRRPLPGKSYITRHWQVSFRVVPCPFKGVQFWCEKNNLAIPALGIITIYAQILHFHLHLNKQHFEFSISTLYTISKSKIIPSLVELQMAASDKNFNHSFSHLASKKSHLAYSRFYHFQDFTRTKVYITKFMR